MIRVLALDIDGVLTDGTVTLDETGKELKTISFRDIDAIYRARRAGFELALITGEGTPWVDMISRRLEISNVYKGALDKLTALKRLSTDLNLPLSQICYVGDSERDAEAFAIAGLALAPANSTPQACAAAHRVLVNEGGKGAVAEAVEILISQQHQLS